jgi:hypothetical protein
MMFGCSTGKINFFSQKAVSLGDERIFASSFISLVFCSEGPKRALFCFERKTLPFSKVVFFR